MTTAQLSVALGATAGVSVDREGPVMDDTKDFLRVTRILELAGLVDFSHVPAAILEAAQRRGTAAHLACELEDRGQGEDLLRHLEQCPEAHGYLAAWLSFKSEAGFTPGLIEEAVACRPQRFRGRLDRTGAFRDGKGPVLLDLKTARTASPVTALQTAAYEMCLEERHRRFVVYLREDGTYRLQEFTSPLDRHVFVAAVTVAHWKVNYPKD